MVFHDKLTAHSLLKINVIALSLASMSYCFVCVGYLTLLQLTRMKKQLEKQ